MNPPDQELSDTPPPEESADETRLQTLVVQCLDRMEQGDEQALDEFCARFPKDAERLRARIQRLGDLGLLEQRDPDQEIPEFVGKYRILRCLGVGGMGVVYEAEQDQPRRTVALKVIRPGRLSTKALRRFAHEAQLLGMLQHPGIAQIYEAGSEGTSGTPAPYFAMELVQGEPLNEFADQQRLSVRERLSLLADICDALQFAHDKGVVHRDLKPGNILVGKSHQPKILDFGLARVTDSDLDLTTLHTVQGQLVGTLPYMSPEQAAAGSEELDPRSDVYAMGVIAYQLLAGRLPYSLAGTSTLESIRIIREEEPTRLGLVNKDLRGDIETIVATALDKDPGRRYTSAGLLAADIRRSLANEPIHARPPSRIYRIRKFTRRHRGLVAGLSCAFLLLIAGIIVSTVAWLEALDAKASAESARESEADQKLVAQEAQRRAETEARQKGAFNNILKGLIRSPDPWGGDGTGLETRVVDILDRAPEMLNTMGLDEEVEWEVRLFLGQTFVDLGVPDRAEPHLERAQELCLTRFGPSHAVTTEVANSLSGLRYLQGRWDEALMLQDQVLEWYQQTKDPRTPSAMNDRGRILHGIGRFEQAEAQYREGLRLARESGVAEASQATLLHNLGTLLMERGDLEQAEKLLNECLEQRTQALGEDHSRTLTTMNSLALLQRRLGRFVQAIALEEAVIEVSTRVLGPSNPRTLASLHNLAGMYREDGRIQDAESTALRILELVEEEDVNVVRAHALLAMVHSSDVPKAVEFAKQAVESAGRCLDPREPDYASAHLTYGQMLAIAKRWHDAQPIMQTAYDLHEESLGLSSTNTLVACHYLGQIHQNLGDLAQAAEHYERVLEHAPGVFARDFWVLLHSRDGLVQCLQAEDRAEDAEWILIEQFEELDADHGLEDPGTIEALTDLINFYERVGMTEEAATYRETLDGARQE